jgi:hypothetical protein
MAATAKFLKKKTERQKQREKEHTLEGHRKLEVIQCPTGSVWQWYRAMIGSLLSPSWKKGLRLLENIMSKYHNEIF